MRTDGAAVWTLIRNLGSSVGISLIIAKLTDNISVFHSQLVEFINPVQRRDEDAGGGCAFLDCTASSRSRALDGLVTQQAAVMAYSNDFLIMTFVSLAAFPLLVLIRRPSAAAAAAGGAQQQQEEHAAVMD